MKDEELTFAEALELAVEIEAASVNARATIDHANCANLLHAVKLSRSAQDKRSDAEAQAVSHGNPRKSCTTGIGTKQQW